MENQESKAQKLLDEFALSAMNALIAKSPFYDSEGEFGKQVSQEDSTEIKIGITKTAYEYAYYMLIAREEQKEWLMANLDNNPNFGS